MPRSALGPILVFAVLMAQPLMVMVPSTTATAGPRFVPSGTVVLFDEAHFPVYTVNPANPSGYVGVNQAAGAYSDFAGVMSKAGFTVRTLDYGYYLDAAALAGVKVLVIVCSQGKSTDGYISVPYTSEEVDAVVQFVKNGGGLFLIGDHTTFPPAIFPIADQFGITYGQKLLHDPNDYVYNSSTGPPAEGDVFIVFGRDNINNHPIMDNITRVELYRTDIFTGLPPEAQPLIISDDDTYYLDEYGSKVAAPRSIVSAAIPSNGTAGAGRIVVVGDTNTFETDENRDDDDQMDLFDSDNARYGLQITEWLADIAEHLGVELVSAEKESLGRSAIAHNCSAGTNSTFYIGVNNAGNVADTYDLRAIDTSGKGWSSTLSLSSVSVNNADGRILTLNVSVPADAQVGDSVRFQVEARSRRSPVIAAAMNCTVDIPALHNITLTCAENRKSVRSGETALFDLLLSNRGNVPEEVELGATGPPGWECSLELSRLGMGPASARTLKLSVAPPPGALGGAEGKVVAAATLAGSAEPTSAADTYTKVIQSFGVRLYCADPVQGVDPGSLASFPVMVTNTGNGDDEVSLSLLGGSRWSTYMEPSHLLIPYNTTVQAAVVTRAPPQAPANETLALEMLGASVRDPGARANLSLKAVVNRIGKFRLDIDPYKRYADPGEVPAFNVTVTNIGNAPERVLLAADGPGWLSLNEVDVAPGEGTVLALQYAVGTYEQAWAEHYIEVTGTSAINSSIQAKAVAVVVVNQVHKVRGELNPDGLELLPGADGKSSLTVRNEGNGPEVVTALFEQGPPGWRLELQYQYINIEAQGERQRQAIIGVPAGTVAGDYNLSLNLSDGAGNWLLLPLKVEVLRILNFTASVQPSVRSAPAGRMASFTLLLENRGNSPEKVRLSPAGGRASWVAPAEPIAMVNYSGGMEIELRVRSAPDAMPGKYRLSVLAVGEDNQTREVVFFLNVKEGSTSTGDMPCILGALLIAAASAAAYLVRRRMKNAQGDTEDQDRAGHATVVPGRDGNGDVGEAGPEPVDGEGPLIKREG